MTSHHQLISIFSCLCLLAPVGAESSGAQVTMLTAAQTKSIDRYVTAEMTRQRIPGVEVGVYRNGQSVLAKGYGLANVGCRYRSDHSHSCNLALSASSLPPPPS